jgi:hypothetical protein
MPLIGVQDLNNPSQVLKSAAVTNPAGGVAEFSDLNPLPSMLQSNFGIQRDLSRGILVEANCVDNHG